MSRSRGRLGSRRPRVPMHAPFMITSMMDMFTIILVFLLNFLDPTNDASQDVSLPEATAGVAVGEAPVLLVTRERVAVDGVDVLRLDDGGFSPGTARTGRTVDALLERLAAARGALPVSPSTGQQGADNAALAVHCDRAVPYSVLAELLYTAGQAGFGEFRFVVIDDAG